MKTHHKRPCGHCGKPCSSLFWFCSKECERKYYAGDKGKKDTRD